jgi:hypothetical protein
MDYTTIAIAGIVALAVFGMIVVVAGVCMAFTLAGGLLVFRTKRDPGEPMLHNVMGVMGPPKDGDSDAQKWEDEIDAVYKHTSFTPEQHAHEWMSVGAGQDPDEYKNMANSIEFINNRIEKSREAQKSRMGDTDAAG